MKPQTDQNIQQIATGAAGITTPILHQALYMLAQNSNTPQNIRDAISNPVQTPTSNNSSSIIRNALNALYGAYGAGANTLKNMVTGDQDSMSTLSTLADKVSSGKKLTPDEMKFVNEYANNNALAVASSSGGIMDRVDSLKYNQMSQKALNDAVSSIAPETYGAPLTNPKPQSMINRDTQEAIRRFNESKYQFTK